MKNFCVKFQIITCIFVVSTIQINDTSAQNMKKMRYFFSNGISEITYSRAYSRLFKTGFSVGFGAEHPFSENIHAQSQFDFHYFGLDKRAFSTYQYEGSGAMIFSFSANIKLLLPAGKTGTPYFIEGIGFSMLNFKDVYYGGDLLYSGHTEAPVTLFFGWGYEIYLSERVNLFTEIKYAVAFSTDESTQYLPFKIGICLNPKKQ